METSRLGRPPLPAPRPPHGPAPGPMSVSVPGPVPTEPPADAACPPAGPGTWAATILVCLLAGASPIIGFLSFAH
nr:hypothetical protein KitaXyl93_73950 [Kitasatospora sp. Xyl93]